jgi:long-chain acyl-CoA synthetase
LFIGITFAVNETESNYMLTTYDLLPKVCNLLARCPKLSTIIYVDSQIQSKNNNNNALNFPKNVKLWSMSKLIADGMKAPEDLQGFPLNSEDIMIIGYTSGTTGLPKGVVATIKQVREAGIATLPVIEKFMKDPEKQVYVAYLPQAHILEASIELIAFLGGCRIGFATPFTLNESAPGLADKEICDLKLLKPTIMTTVPLVLDRMRKEMYFKLDNRTPISTHLFNYLIDYKIKWTQKGINGMRFKINIFSMNFLKQLKRLRMSDCHYIIMS